MPAVGTGAVPLRSRGRRTMPLVLGLVLSNGDVAPFLTRPISPGLPLVTLATVLLYIPACKTALRRIAAAVAR